MPFQEKNVHGNETQCQTATYPFFQVTLTLLPIHNHCDFDETYLDDLRTFLDGYRYLRTGCLLSQLPLAHWHLMAQRQCLSSMGNRPVART